LTCGLARRHLASGLLGVVLLSAHLSAATRYDPRLRFRTIRTAHFTVLFHQDGETLARRLATIAEEVHATLSRRLQVSDDRHTRVILVDQNDDANGWATPLPFDTIEISAAAPAPSGQIGNTDDWLRMVFTHEYTHILHLDRSRGLFGALRHVFGRAPLLFPNIFLPGWETEGLATFYETADTGQGRLRSGEFRLLVDAAARAGRFDPMDRATGALVDWPGANAAYAYGARFHEYLAKRFGPDAFARLAAATAGRVPYMPGGAYKKVFGASAHDLWEQFARSQTTGGSDGGFRRQVPTVGSDGRFLQEVPTAGSDGRFRREVPTGGSDGRFRQEVPTAGSDGRFRREVPTVGSDGRFRRQVPTVGSDGRFRRQVPTVGSDGRFRRQVPTVGSDRGFRREVPTVGSDGRFRQEVPTVGSDEVQAAVVRETGDGFVASGPRWLPDGTLLYSSRTPHRFPSLRIVSRGGASRKLADRYLGERVSIANGRAYFDQQELVRNVGLQGDLYAVTLRDGRVERLTRGARAADPDVSPDGRTIVYTVQQSGRMSLVLRPIETTAVAVRLGPPRVLRDDPDTQYAAPRWSPDGRIVSAERRRLHERPDVVLIDVPRRAIVARVTADAGRVGEPEWLPDGSRLIVSWERPDLPFNLYEVDPMGASEARALLELASGARSASVSPDGRRLAFVGYTVDGYDIFSAPLRRAMGPVVTGLGVERSSTGSTGSMASPASIGSPGSSEPYSPVSSLLPRFWMPLLETDEDRVEVGAGTGGLDVLGRHAYASTVRWADRARPDWDVAYAYDRWRPTVLLSASDDLTVWQGADYRETSVDAGVLLPFSTVRRRQWLYGSIHATREEDPNGSFARRSLRLAYQFRTARHYGYSISPQEGLLAGVTAEMTRKALGSDADATTVTADLRAYPPVGGRHRVLALRAAFAGSYGDLDGRRIVGAGGTAAPGTTIAFGRDAVGLARGFAIDDIVGYRAAVVNVDYRVPLWTIERGLGRLPVFVRQVHAAVFVDAAHAWRRTFVAADARASAGLEVSADVVLGHYLPLTFAGGMAARRDPSRAHEGATAFWRIGYAF
jgi:hypothetical protein